MSGLRRAIAVALWLLSVATVAPASAESVEEIFERGNEAYSEGRWAAAADAYRTLLDYRIEDARVHYNLAAAEFRLGRLGPSILHYEKALRLAPADEEIRSSLEYARSFRFDRVEVDPPMPLVLWTQRVQDRLGVSGQAWILVTLFWAAGGILAVGLSRPGRFGPFHGWALAAVGSLLVVAALSWWSTLDRLERRLLAVVMAPAADVVAGPGAANPTLVTVHEGLTVEILSVGSEWVQVSLPNGLKGWLRRADLAAV